MRLCMCHKRNGVSLADPPESGSAWSRALARAVSEVACAAGRDQEPANLNESDRSCDCSIVLYQRITNPAETIRGQKADLQQEIAE